MKKSDLIILELERFAEDCQLQYRRWNDQQVIATEDIIARVAQEAYWTWQAALEALERARAVREGVEDRGEIFRRSMAAKGVVGDIS